MKSQYCCWFLGALLELAQGKAAQADTAPGDAVPLDAPSRLAYRQRAQLKSAATQKAFHNFRFTDRTADSGITFHSHCVDDVGKNNKPIHYDHGCGIAVADVDGDGLPDIYFVSQLGGNELWRNLGNGKFENITASTGVGLSDRICVAASFADVDNDGLPDLFVTTVRGGNVLADPNPAKRRQVRLSFPEFAAALFRPGRGCQGGPDRGCLALRTQAVG